jgi:hypothetical protein
MLSLFRLATTVSIILSLFPAAVSATRCTSEQREKMAGGGLSPQEITHICDPPTLSLEEASERLTAYASKHQQHETWFNIGMPRPTNIELHDLNRYYQALKQEGYVTRWEEDRRTGDIKLELTRKGKRFIQTGKSKFEKYSLLCCKFEGFEVTCLTVSPAGDFATGVFKASPSELFMSLQWAAKRDVTSVEGLVDFRRDVDGWRVDGVWITTHIKW